MNRPPRGSITVFCILVVLFLVAPGGSATCSSGTSSCIPSLSTSSASGAAVSPVSDTYVAPPGVMPVVILNGTPYEMGYQYGLEVPEYIAITRDAAWASALSTNSYADIMDNCSIDRHYIETDLPGFDFLAFFDGMSDAMNDQGYAFTPNDAIVMNYYGGRQGPGPEEHCTAFAASGNATGGSVIAGQNFDYYPVPSNSYSVVLALYPETGHAAIIPSGAGRTGSSAAANDQGLVYTLVSGPSKGSGDTGPGITGFLELPYVALTAANVEEAQAFLLNSTRAYALNHVLADKSGNAEVIEATRSRYAIRYPGDTGNADFIVATNHYLNTTMKPSQPVWDPREYYPSSYYRYITAEKELSDNFGNVSYATARTIFSLTDWWDGTAWHDNDPYSTNTINRFRPDVASLYSFIAVPSEGVVSICTGNPGIPTWGTRTSRETGTYVNYTVGKTPVVLVYDLRVEADAAMWKAMTALGTHPDPESTAARLYSASEDTYWEAVWWHDRGVLENDRTTRAVELGKAATRFSEVIARSGQVQSLCSSGTCT